MKILRYLSFFVAAAVALSSCQKDPRDIFPVTAIAPVMDANAVVILTENTFNEDVTYSWSPARNIGEVTYTLYMSFDAQDVKLTDTAELFYTSTKGEFHKLLNDSYTLPANDNYSIELYVVATNADGETLESGRISSLIFVSGEIVAPVLSAGADAKEDIVLSIEDAKDLVLLEWTAARFGYNIPVLYDVTVIYDGDEKSKATFAEGLDATQLVINSAALNSLLRAKGYVGEVAQAELTFSLEGYYSIEVPAEKEGEEATESRIPAPAKEVVTVKVTTYEPETTAPAAGAGVPAEGLALSLDTEDAIELLAWEPANIGAGLELNYEVLAKVVGSDKEAFVVEGEVGLQSELNKKKEEGDKEEAKTFDAEAVVDLYAIHVTHEKFNAQLLANGAKPEVACEVEFSVRASDKNNKDAYAVSEATKVNITPCRPPYPEAISIVGGFCGLSWGETADLSPVLKQDSGKPNMYSGVVTIDGDSDECKLYYIDAKGEPAWVGGATEQTASPYTFDLTSGDNIKLPKATYIFIVDLDEKKMVAHEVKSVGLIGNGNWDSQSNFTYNAATYTYELKNVALTDEFKIRFNDDWGNWHDNGVVDPSAGYNLGGESADKLTYGSGNLKVELGTYDLSITFSDNTNFVLNCNKVGEAEEPEEPEKPKVNEWGIVGPGNDWNNDIKLVAQGAWFVAKDVALTTSDKFKIRANGEWVLSYGAEAESFVATVGKFTALTSSDGKDMAVAADGKYDIYFNEAQPMLCVVTAGTANPLFGLMGTFANNEWKNDIWLEADGDYLVAQDVTFAGAEAEFKVRENSDWGTSYGVADGATPAIGAAIVLDGGSNVKLTVDATAKYDVYFSRANDTKTVWVMADGEKPAL